MKMQNEKIGKTNKLVLNKQTVLQLTKITEANSKQAMYFITWDDITGCTSRATNDSAKGTR